MLRRPLALLGLALGIASCKGDSPVAPVTVAVTVSASPSNPKPGGSSTITITANPKEGDRVTWLGLRIEGLGYPLESDSVAIADGSNVAEATLYFPVAFGTVRVTGFARTAKGALGESTITMVLADQILPSVSVGMITPSPSAGAEPGDVISVRVMAIDDVAMRYLAIHANGALVATDSVTSTSGAMIDRTVTFTVPKSGLGQTLVLSAKAQDVAGNVAQASIASYLIKDVSAPRLSATLSGGSGHGTYAPTDTVRFTLAGTDNVALRYVGYSLDGPFNVRDSAFTGGTTYSRSVSIPIEGRSGSATLTLFGRDSVGNVTATPAGLITIGTRARAAVATVTLANAAAVNDIAFDQKRSRIYLSQTDASQVAVVDLLTATELAPYAITGGPVGLDVTAGGDSLLVALRSLPSLAVLNLASGGRSSLQVDATRSASSVRAMANGHAIVALTFAGSGYGGNVVDFDLASGAARGQILVTERVPLVRSADRKRVFGLIDDSCCPESAFWYDATTSTFSAPVGTVSRFFPQVATNADGSRFFADTLIFSSTLQRLGAFSPPLNFTAMAANADPSVIFVASLGAVRRIRLSDSAVLETITLPFTPSKLLMLPDGLTLVAAAGNRAAVIDLW